MRQQGSLLSIFWTATALAAPVLVDEHIQQDPFNILDPQKWQNPDDMTWADYKPIPEASWVDPTRKGSMRNFNIALVPVDYPDMNFVVTQAANSTAFGNPLPIVSGMKRANVPSYYRDLLNMPQDLNYNHTLHEYWMEDSGGRFGVDLTAFGPYRMPRKSFQYGLDDGEGGFNEGECPEAPCSVDLRTDALGAWRAEVGNATADLYELVFILSAGQDESSSWQEFGEMKFDTKEDVSHAFGPPGNSSDNNWAPTRYVDWTSWASAASIWPNAGRGSSTQAESSGAAVYAHELSHLLGIGDNYNNPYSDPPRRSWTGIWSMMSRGSFNGPGGPHTRWQIPALQGSSLGSLHTVRDKLQLGLVDNSSMLMLSREDLKAVGTMVVNITARAVDEGETGLKGLRITMDTDKSPFCNITTDPFCDGGGFDSYDLEVIDRVGADSFTPDSGVLISKSKVDDSDPPFQWVIDANPQDIKLVDFIRPNGTEAMVTIGDYRQLADALFHAGTRSGSQFEHIDRENGLHFYIVNPHRDELGVLRYEVAARSLEGNTTNMHEIQMSDGNPSKTSFDERGGFCEFELTNSGSLSVANFTTSQNSSSSYAGYEIFRLSAEVEGAEWRVELPNEISVVKFGGKTLVSVAVGPEADAVENAVVKLTAVSESDGSVMVMKECEVQKGGVGKRYL
ncbi:uncharacterized protein RCC_05483 [Ramularia collo-cygni]|uniref:Peptidase M6-like domain-containing protein n=1 Tax=Ramularia collo-cygni TaxID=112498 RepID=A0A2D3URA9_9PEZI|nr:uncharacterized protein RCC_05483 [Ramularia collo-cygni]CZT19632.1 uncharacterized protein RCC_05483 [Ramularia collo-cygni]